MKKIIVTGGIGFLGTNLCLALLKQGHEVFALDNFHCARKENLELLKKHKNFNFIWWDIRNPLDHNEFGRIDEIYNLACPASPPTYQKNPIFTMETCVNGVINLARFAHHHGAVLLQASTSECYGQPDAAHHPQKEDYNGNVNSLGIRANYDNGKRAAETLMMDFHRKYDLRIKIPRIHNTSGPHMSPKDGRVVSNLIMQALYNTHLTIYGDGKQTRSFCYVDDMVDGLIATMESHDSFLGPVNLGNPKEITIYQLARKILELIPESNSEIIYRPLPQDDPLQRCPDISLAKEKLNWQPKIDYEAGLIKTIEYFRSLDA